MLKYIFQIYEDIGGQKFTLNAEESLFISGDPVNYMFLLLAGRIDMVRYHEDGRMITLHSVKNQAVLAEASLYAEHYHCNALCVETSDVLAVNRQHFQECLVKDLQLAQIWSQYLAQALQMARHRGELLTRKTVAGRLSGWLDQNKGILPEKGHWKTLASELGVTPEALYRTLAQYKAKDHP